MRSLLLLFILAAFPALAEDPKVAALIRQGDAAERSGNPRAALGFFRAAEQIDPQNVGVLLRISKQYSDLIGVTKPPAAAAQIAQRSLQYAERAAKLDPTVAKGHLSLAIAYGKLTDFVGNKEKLEYSKIIKSKAEKAIELDPTDDFAWHVLARWHSGVANVNSVLKLMASVVYGGLPVASNEEAARCLRKAADLAPRRLIHRSELARVYKIMGKRELAEKEWKAVLALSPQDAEDVKDQEEARTELNLPKQPSTPSRTVARRSTAISGR